MTNSQQPIGHVRESRKYWRQAAEANMEMAVLFAKQLGLARERIAELERRLDISASEDFRFPADQPATDVRGLYNAMKEAQARGAKADE